MYCIVCDDEIRKGESLERHIEINHPLICSVCELSVPDDVDLESHIETYHPGVHMR